MSERIDRGAAVAAGHGAGPRSPHWASVEKAYREAHPDCLACDPDNPIEHVGIQVHHSFIPYHIAILLGLAYMELDERNLLSFGETEAGQPAPDHHELIAHGGNFQLYNPNLVEDAATFRGMSTEAIKADPRWQAIHADKSHYWSKPWHEWSDAEKIACRADILARFPPDPAMLARFGLPTPEPMETWRP